MNSEEMKQYSDSIAQAADVVNNENQEDAKMSVLEKKTLAIANGGNDKQAELDAKAALIE